MNVLKKGHYILGVVLFASIGNAWSQDLDAGFGDEAFLLGDIPSVFGASKYEQKVTEAPSRISVVTGDEIRAYGYRTLNELLRSLPGFSTSNDRNYAYTGVRGFGIPGDYDTRLLQLVDGHRVNDNIYASLFSGQSFPVDLHLIERVEVIRGPSSSLYGSSAFFGVVNVITKHGRDIGGWEVSAATGSLETNQARITYGNRLDSGLEVLFSGTASKSDGQSRLYFPDFDDPATNDGIAEGVDGQEFYKFFARASIGDFSVEGAYGTREKVIPTAPYYTVFNARETRTEDIRSYLDFKYQTLLRDGAEVVARLYYDDYRYHGDYLYDYGDPGDPYISLNHDNAIGEWWGAELQWRKRLADHHLVFGFDYRDSLTEMQENFDLDGIYLDERTDSSVVALFVQDEIRLANDVVLNLGLRYDDYSEFGGTTNPRAAVIWTPLPGTGLKLLYGEAFRAPNAYEQHYNDGNVTTKAARDLRPETITTLEVVWEQQIRDKLRGTMSVYKNRISDLLALTTDPADGLLVFANEGDAEARGVEVELENQWQNGISATVNYTHQRAEDSATGARLVNYAENMAKLNLMAPLFDERVHLALEGQYESGRLTLDGDETDGRLLVNLSMNVGTWFEQLSATVTAYNLFDEDYAEPASEEHQQNVIEQDGRTVQVRLEFTF